MFTAEFIWNTKLLIKHPNQKHVYETCNKGQDVICIVGLFYWELDDCGLERLQKFHSNSTLFVTVPPRRINPRMLSICDCRNTWIRANNALYLPLAEMASEEVFQRTVEDQMHFQCAFHGLLQDGDFKYTSPQKTELYVKSPANKDCRDILNLNLAMIIAHFWEHRLVS